MDAECPPGHLLAYPLEASYSGEGGARHPAPVEVVTGQLVCTGVTFDDGASGRGRGRCARGRGDRRARSDALERRVVRPVRDRRHDPVDDAFAAVTLATAPFGGAVAGGRARTPWMRCCYRCRRPRRTGTSCLSSSRSTRRGTPTRGPTRSRSTSRSRTRPTWGPRVRTRTGTTLRLDGHYLRRSADIRLVRHRAPRPGDAHHGDHGRRRRHRRAEHHVQREYYDEVYTTVSVNSNGFLAMGTCDYRFGDNSSIPDGHGPPAMIAPFWDDLDPSAGGDLPLLRLPRQALDLPVRRGRAVGDEPGADVPGHHHERGVSPDAHERFADTHPV